ncbi:hypothetical protein I7I50_01535 [Histoplasma capsulatum G186AR]|uniref:Uncharacterized protein n=1 Tax=Ajellomyces capsulatus TaxID=5037 RepID=A0A8H7YAS2_AJECA|nr:hypothetical protein I7I52_12651 [Histoplasma capsulatum]QSS73390.1 hypothetical protein I7I50_01535 [Histoplasma capsulatum G186AR]
MTKRRSKNDIQPSPDGPGYCPRPCISNSSSNFWSYLSVSNSHPIPFSISFWLSEQRRGEARNEDKENREGDHQQHITPQMQATHPDRPTR